MLNFPINKQTWRNDHNYFTIYRSISQPAKLPRNFSELAGNAELDGFSISEEIDPFYLNRQLSQPVHYENGQHTQFFYDYDDEEASGTAAERRNRFQVTVNLVPPSL